MTEMAAPGAEAMPRSVRVVMGWLTFQALANALFGVYLLHAIDTDLDRGLRVEHLGFLRFLSVWALSVAVLLLVCVGLATRRYAWIRSVVMLLQAVGLATDVIGLPLGAGLGTFVGILLALIVLSLLASSPAKEWFNR